MRIAKLLGQIVESALSIAGIRIGTEGAALPTTTADQGRRPPPLRAPHRGRDDRRRRRGPRPQHRASDAWPATYSEPTTAKRRLDDRARGSAVRRGRDSDDRPRRTIPGYRQPLDDSVLHAVEVDDRDSSSAH